MWACFPPASPLSGGLAHGLLPGLVVDPVELAVLDKEAPGAVEALVRHGVVGLIGVGLHPVVAVRILHNIVFGHARRHGPAGPLPGGAGPGNVHVHTALAPVGEVDLTAAGVLLRPAPLKALSLRCGRGCGRWCGLAFDGDERGLGVGRAGVIGEAAVDLPAVELHRDVVQRHILGITLDDLQRGKLLSRLEVVEILRPVRAHEMPLGDFGVFIARDELALAAHRHDLGAGVLRDHGRVGIAGRGGASAAGPRTLHRDERRGSVRRAGIVGKAAVDLPAVELRGDLVQGHVLAVAIDDLQGRELLGRLQVIDIPAPVGAHEMPHRPLGVFITGDELALAAHVHGLAGGILFDHGQLGVCGRRGRGRFRGLGGRRSQRGRRRRRERRGRRRGRRCGRTGRLGRGDRKAAAGCCGRSRLLGGCGLRRSGCLRGSHGHGLRVVLLFPAGAQRQQGQEDAEDNEQFLFHGIDLSVEILVSALYSQLQNFST